MSSGRDSTREFQQSRREVGLGIKIDDGLRGLRRVGARIPKNNSATGKQSSRIDNDFDATFVYRLKCNLRFDACYLILSLRVHIGEDSVRSLHIFKNR